MYVGGAHGANRSVTIQLDEGATDFIVCIIHLRLPLPKQRAIVVICSATLGSTRCKVSR